MSASAALPHQPVLLTEVCAALAPVRDGVIVDGTFGRGGHTRALLAGGARRVIGIDQDPEALAAAAPLAAADPRFQILSGNFAQMERLLAVMGVTQVQGILLDIGVSSPQLDEAGRGFSFRLDGPLDMRMAQRGPSAADIVNTAGEDTLADILFFYGEERAARRIARAIVTARQVAPIRTTSELAGIVRAQLPRPRPGQIDNATRSFQALRMAVNDELGALAEGLQAAERLLEAGGRLAVISFHSLEDRMVKHFLQHRSGRAGQSSRHQPEVRAAAPSFTLIGKQPQAANDDECAVNARARSAKLRVAERTAAPAQSGFPDYPLARRAR